MRTPATQGPSTPRRRGESGQNLYAAPVVAAEATAAVLVRDALDFGAADGDTTQVGAAEAATAVSVGKATGLKAGAVAKLAVQGLRAVDIGAAEELARAVDTPLGAAAVGVCDALLADACHDITGAQGTPTGVVQGACLAAHPCPAKLPTQTIGAVNAGRKHNPTARAILNDRGVGAATLGAAIIAATAGNAQH